MTKLFSKSFEAVTAPFLRDNVDTDIIMPKQFLMRIDRAGLIDGVFHDLRFDNEGNRCTDFILNQPAYARATCLVTGENFGCGSSREHAVWGLVQFGIRVILAPSFAGIFSDNAARNGLLLVRLDPNVVSSISSIVSDPACNRIIIDLSRQRLVLATGEVITFDVDGISRNMLLEGRDLIDTTLGFREDIRRFEEQHRTLAPWLVTAPDDP